MPSLLWKTRVASVLIFFQYGFMNSVSIPAGSVAPVSLFIFVCPFQFSFHFPILPCVGDTAIMYITFLSCVFVSFCFVLNGFFSGDPRRFSTFAFSGFFSVNHFWSMTTVLGQGHLGSSLVL